MTQHTPGPWLVLSDDDHSDALTIQDQDELTIADIWGFAAPDRDGQEQANARLIAAAPELLAALREACAYIYATHPHAQMPAIHQRACELIARVEGREV